MDRDIPWEQGPATDLCPFRACFRMDSECGDHEPDERMFELWETYRQRHDEHVQEFARRLVALFRGVTWLPGMPYSADWPTPEILKLTRQATVLVSRAEFQDEMYYALQVRFDLDWDDEHGYALPFDEATETFGAWQE